jgi:hypothetical protein
MSHSHNDFFYLALIANNTDLPTLARVKAIEALIGNGNTMASDAIRDASSVKVTVKAVKPAGQKRIIRCRFPA